MPASSQCFVQVDESDLLVADGIAQADLCFKVSTLCIEQVHVSNDSFHVLQLCQFKGAFGRLFQTQTGFVDFLDFVEFYNGIISILECTQDSFFISIGSLFVGRLLGFQHCTVLSHGEKRLQQVAHDQMMRRFQQIA